MAAASSPGLKPPGLQDLTAKNLASTWHRWKEEIELYLDLTVKADNQKKRKKMFLYVIGQESREVYETLTFEKEEAERTLKDLIDAFDTYCSPKKNQTVERYKFFTRAQKAGETFDEYLTELRHLATDCGFGEIRDSLIRDRILCGITDGKVRERLLRIKDLTLANCEETCRAAEISQRSLQTMEPVSVHAVIKKTTQMTAEKPMSNNCK
ncbi:PREDICTED: uncharacterized protein LOC109476703 [Branchiostoma belcheri]|uniref:Uncharacterized protein LOC109476703 n=1 Tax=Branchiostoma belcheri TaxID=7741 RepID=A0A6P4ZUJ3_BRABE|nr:PREDICTED: uncharacterized protein LOC109476703 [Branchiostoma belcheri]